MITTVLAALFGSKNEREVRRYQESVARINRKEAELIKLSDEQLKNKTIEFKQRIENGESLNSLAIDAFAVAREMSRRVMNMRPYDVQLIGGLALHEGKIAEMKTGEGKTLVATLPMYLNALSGKGAHLVTVNDYLARRDAEWMRPLYEALGLTVGVVQSDSSDAERKEAYAADITYGTNSQFGFDYLRDNMKFHLDDYVQRDLNFVIVDEVDSILIDEARTPLIISGPSEKGSNLYIIADKAISRLSLDDYEVDEKMRNVQLHESGVDKIEKELQVGNLYAPENMLILHHITQALKAHTLFKKDVDYMVIENQVFIVDEFTGRVLHGRRYSDGLHQAIEAKEKVRIERENQTLASITLQNYFRMYNKLSGMTGTASTEAEEFHKIYKMDVVSIPTNKPIARIDEDDAIFLNESDKFEAVIEDILECHKKDQPVLVGTTSVEKSELLSNLLNHKGISHNVLNAKHHEKEADIVTEAGHKGKITIATNMAGRGTDIKLSDEVLANGGLRIIGTERHESRRIDNQLRGRAGRQGDPGSSKFYISLEDELIRIFSGDRLKQIMESLPFGWGMQKGERIEHPMISRNIESNQERVEKYRYESRKHTLEYDDILNQQRKVVYNYRREILEGGKQIFDVIKELIRDVVAHYVSVYAPQKRVNHEELGKIFESLEIITGIEASEFKKAVEGVIHDQALIEEISTLLISKYDAVRSQIDEKTMHDAEKWTLLEIVDQHWKIHLQHLDSIREGIGLRGYGQKNPLLEYKKEAFTAFQNMMNAVKTDVIARLFTIKPELFSQAHIDKIEQERIDELAKIQEIGSDESGNPTPVKRGEPKVGRNDKCPCGSGKKYKQCCLKSE